MSQDEPDCDQRYNLECRPRFDNIEVKLDDVLKLLRGEGSDPGLVGDVRTHGEQIADLKRTQQQRGTFVESILNKLLTAAIIALIALLFSMYRAQGNASTRSETPQPAATGATDDPTEPRAR